MHSAVGEQVKFQLEGGATVTFKDVGTGLVLAQKTGSSALAGLGGRRPAPSPMAVPSQITGLLTPWPITHAPPQSLVCAPALMRPALSHEQTAPHHRRCYRADVVCDVSVMILQREH